MVTKAKPKAAKTQKPKAKKRPAWPSNGESEKNPPPPPPAAKKPEEKPKAQETPKEKQEETPRKQPELPGVEHPKTKAQKLAGELLDAEDQLTDAMELVDDRRERLLGCMKESGEHTVKVLSTAGRRFTYRLVQLEKLTRKKDG